VRPELSTAAATHGFQKFFIKTENFQLLSYQRVGQRGGTATFYIEGDGFAFTSRQRVSSNPTPRNPLGLKLALLDHAENVIYLARPCQFVPILEEMHCDPAFWTGKRYAPMVVESINEAIDNVKQKMGIHRVRLVGYSGGGTIAAILAARRHDIIDLRTLAGNLDIVAFTRQHKVTPLSGSLNPTDFAAGLANMPQLHLVGEEDKTITRSQTESYLHALREYDPALQCVYVLNLAGVSHVRGWEDIWNLYAGKVIKCKPDLGSDGGNK